MIAILDYQMGNLLSVSKSLQKVGAQCEITRDPETVRRAEKLVVPGVGAFKDCMAGLKKQHLVEPILEFIRSGRPYLGICLGMQILMEESEEGGRHQGLGVFPGRVERFAPELKLKVPHMGWNVLHKEKESKLLKDIAEESYVYFVHSYYVNPKNKKKISAASTDYGVSFTSVIEFENIYAVQFHPEKSQRVGLALLKSFVESA